MSRLRISAHNLRIETGRHVVPKIPLNERLCKHCKVIDSELHFLLQCTSKQEFIPIRDQFMCDVSNINQEFSNLNEDDKFVYLMSSDSNELSNILVNYLGKLVRLRGSL